MILKVFYRSKSSTLDRKIIGPGLLILGTKKGSLDLVRRVVEVVECACLIGLFDINVMVKLNNFNPN